MNSKKTLRRCNIKINKKHQNFFVNQNDENDLMKYWLDSIEWDH